MTLVYVCIASVIILGFCAYILRILRRTHNQKKYHTEVALLRTSAQAAFDAGDIVKSTQYLKTAIDIARTHTLNLLRDELILDLADTIRDSKPVKALALYIDIERTSTSIAYKNRARVNGIMTVFLNRDNPVLAESLVAHLRKLMHKDEKFTDGNVVLLESLNEVNQMRPTALSLGAEALTRARLLTFETPSQSMDRERAYIYYSESEKMIGKVLRAFRKNALYKEDDASVLLMAMETKLLLLLHKVISYNQARKKTKGIISYFKQTNSKERILPQIAYVFAVLNQLCLLSCDPHFRVRRVEQFMKAEKSAVENLDKIVFVKIEENPTRLLLYRNFFPHIGRLAALDPAYVRLFYSLGLPA